MKPSLPPSPRSLEQLPSEAVVLLHSPEGPYGSFALADLVRLHGDSGTIVLVFLSDLVNDANEKVRFLTTVREQVRRLGEVSVLFFGPMYPAQKKGTEGTARRVGTSYIQHYNYAEALLRPLSNVTLVVPTQEILAALNLRVTETANANTSGCDALVYIKDNHIMWTWDGQGSRGGFNFEGLKEQMESNTDIAVDSAPDDASDEAQVEPSLTTHMLPTESEVTVDLPG